MAFSLPLAEQKELILASPETDDVTTVDNFGTLAVRSANQVSGQPEDWTVWQVSVVVIAIVVTTEVVTRDVVVAAVVKPSDVRSGMAVNGSGFSTVSSVCMSVEDSAYFKIETDTCWYWSIHVYVSS